MNSVSVIMYHALESAAYPAGSADAGEQRYVLKVEQFREQLEYMRKAGFRTLLIQELLAQEQWPEKAVVLTFDDGHESNFRLALPLLREYGCKAEFFITTGWTGTPRFMDADQVSALSDAGMGIGSHGVSHRFLDDLNDGEIERELKESMEFLSGITGREINSFSAPGGRLRRAVAAIAERLGYRAIFTSRPGLLEKGDRHFSIPRFAIRDNTDIVSYMAMVNGDREYVDKLARHDKILFLAKKVLGNRGYELARNIMLRKA